MQTSVCTSGIGMCLQLSLLRIKDGSPMSVGDIVGSVESVEGKVGMLALLMQLFCVKYCTCGVSMLSRAVPAL